MELGQGRIQDFSIKGGANHCGGMRGPSHEASVCVHVCVCVSACVHVCVHACYMHACMRVLTNKISMVLGKFLVAIERFFLDIHVWYTTLPVLSIL